MYIKLDKFLLEDVTLDSWYDDGFSIAQEMLSQFSPSDWVELSRQVLTKPLEWQKKLIYCLDNEIIAEELNIIVKLIRVNDLELFDMCIDALRAFDHEIGHKYVVSNRSIITDIKERIEDAGTPTKKVLEDFLCTFESR